MSNNIFGNNSNQTKSKYFSKGFYIVLLLCLVAGGIISLLVYSDYANNQEIQNSIVKSLEDEQGQQTVLEPVLVKEDDRPADNEETSIGTAASKEVVKKFVKPVAGEVSLKFSKDELLYSKTMNDWRVHLGTDFKASLGTSVKAISDGVVKKVYNDDLMGQIVEISHANEYVSIYANLSTNVSVKEGQSVKQGDTIGGIGETAIAEIAQEAHVHLEVTHKGVHVDPESLFK